MAIEDYFKGSSEAYGQLAGSLLAGNRKADKKRAKRALIASTVMGTFGALQQQQKQKIIDGTAEVNTKYQDIFDNNEEIYNKKRGTRADYLAYKENPNDYIETKAAQLFNQDLELQAELGTNPYSRLSQADLTPESYASAMDLLDDKRKIAKDYIEAQAGNAAVTTQTFTKFNAAAKEEREAALASVEDDPYKQGLIKSAFSKIFGTGEEKKNKLLTDLQTAKDKRIQQESTIPYMETVKGKEELINSQIKQGVDKVDKEGFMYETKTMVLEKDNKAILKYIEDAQTKNILPGSPEEKELEKNITSAYRKGLKVSKIKELDEIQENNIPDFVSTFTKIDRIKKFSPDMDPTDFLSVKERDMYDLGMGITRNDINALEEIQNKTNRLEVASNIKSIINNKGENADLLSMIEGNFGTDTTEPTGLSSVFISNVIRAKTHLMNKYDMDDIEALKTSMDMQLEGLSLGQGGSFEDIASSGWWKRNTTLKPATHGIEYVNPDVENLPIIPDTANLHAQNLNEYKYLQNRTYKDAEGISQTLRPDKVGKEYVVDDKDFTVSFIVNDKNKWVPSVIYK